MLKSKTKMTALLNANGMKLAAVADALARYLLALGMKTVETRSTAEPRG